MAQQIIDAGGLRADWVFLESLAGVGHKPKRCELSYERDSAFPIDTHIHRLR